MLLYSRKRTCCIESVLILQMLIVCVAVIFNTYWLVPVYSPLAGFTLQVASGLCKMLAIYKYQERHGREGGREGERETATGTMLLVLSIHSMLPVLSIHSVCYRYYQYTLYITGTINIHCMLLVLSIYNVHCMLYWYYQYTLYVTDQTYSCLKQGLQDRLRFVFTT